MKRIISIIVIMLLLGVGAWVITGKNPAATDPYTTYAAVQQTLASGAKLYDVRTASEYSAGHFPGAENWSLQDMQTGKLPAVAKDTVLFVYCHSGNRSGQATAILKDAGFTRIVDLHGLSDVQAMGGQLVQ